MCILEKSPLADVSFINIFTQSMCCLFNLLTLSFVEQKFLILMRSIFSVISLMDCVVGVLSQESSLKCFFLFVLISNSSWSVLIFRNITENYRLTLYPENMVNSRISCNSFCVDYYEFSTNFCFIFNYKQAYVFLCNWFFFYYFLLCYLELLVQHWTEAVKKKTIRYNVTCNLLSVCPLSFFVHVDY